MPSSPGECGGHEGRLAEVGARERGRDASRCQHDDAIAQGHQFLEVARDDDEAVPAIGQITQSRVNRLPGADVDAARRLVHEQHGAVAQQPAGQHDLLLVAAAQRVGALLQALSANIETLDHRGRRRAPLAPHRSTSARGPAATVRPD